MRLELEILINGGNYKTLFETITTPTSTTSHKPVVGTRFEGTGLVSVMTMTRKVGDSATRFSRS